MVKFCFSTGVSKRPENHKQSIFFIKVPQALKSKKINNQKINSEIRFIAESNSVIHSLTYISVKWQVFKWKNLNEEKMSPTAVKVDTDGSQSWTRTSMESFRGGVRAVLLGPPGSGKGTQVGLLKFLMILHT